MGNSKKRDKNHSKINDKYHLDPFKESVPKRLIWFALFVIAIVTYLIYRKAVNFDFLLTWDDNLYITQNHDITALNLSSIKMFFTKFYANNYQPLSMLLYAIEYKIGSGRASLFHFNNIIIHILNALLVYYLIRKLSPKSQFAAMITSAMFALHPMHVESVAWVAERKDVLYSFFFLLSLISYTEYLNSARFKHLFLTGLFFLLSCFSKSAAVVLPLALFSIDYYAYRKLNWKLLLEKIPLFAISLIFGLVAIKSQENSIHDMAPGMSTVQHVFIVSYSFTAYILKAILPVKLSGFYPYPPELGATLSLSYYISVFCIGIFLFLSWFSLRWGRDVMFGFLFFIITIILVLQIFPVGAAIMADRYTYIPYIGIFFIVGKLFEFIIQSADLKKYRSYTISILVVVLIVFSAMSCKRVQFWQNDEIFFSKIINDYPYVSQAYKNRGSYYLGLYAYNKNQRKILNEKAISDFEKLISYSSNGTEKAIAYNNIGVAKSSLADYEGAVQYYSKSIEADSLWSKAYSDRGALYVNYFANNLYAGNYAVKENYLKKAITDFEGNIRHSKASSEKAVSSYSIGCIKFQLRNYESSIKYFDEAIRIDDKYSDAYNNRGSSKNILKNYKGAIADFNRVIELNPKNAAAYFNRGVNNYAIEDYANAVIDFSRAVMLDGNLAIAYSLRGNSYLKLQQYENAINDFNVLLKLNPQDINSMNDRNLALSLMKK